MKCPFCKQDILGLKEINIVKECLSGLFTFLLVGSFAFFASIVIYIGQGIYLVHPVISISCFIGCALFSILTYYGLKKIEIFKKEIQNGNEKEK